MQLDYEYINTLPVRNRSTIIKRFENLELECIEKHNGKYTYDNALYRGMAHKLNITCPVHGDYQQSLDQHLKAGYGCRKCADENNTVKMNKNTFINDSNNIHKQKYDYSLIPEVFKKTDKQQIICEKHGIFHTTYYSHVNLKTGCRKCAQEYHDIDFRKRFFDKPTVLYYVKLYHELGEFWKLGITNRFKDNDISQRFKSENVKFELIHIEYFVNGKYAWEKEQQLLCLFKLHIIPQDKIILKNGGNSEIFLDDCLYNILKKENNETI